MTLLVQLFTSFITGLCFGIIVNVPRRVLIQCGFVGMSGWVVNWLLLQQNVTEIYAIFMGATVVSIVSIIFARRYKVPTTTFNLPGFFPLVPGISAYQALTYLMSGQYMAGIEMLSKTLMLSVTIALAIVIVEVMLRVIERPRKARV